MSALVGLAQRWRAQRLRATAAVSRSSVLGYATALLPSAAVLAACLLVAAGCALAFDVGRSSDRAAGPATVAEVVDGDTVDVKLGSRTERVRLIGIDTPEVAGGFLPAECYGDEASAYTASLLPVGTEVRLTQDVEARDRYDRLLAYIHRADDGLFVNLEIAAAGYAEALIIEPNTIHADHFYAAAARARDQDLGLWGVCGGADLVLE